MLVTKAWTLAICAAYMSGDAFGKSLRTSRNAEGSEERRLHTDVFYHQAVDWVDPYDTNDCEDLSEAKARYPYYGRGYGYGYGYGYGSGYGSSTRSNFVFSGKGKGKKGKHMHSKKGGYYVGQSFGADTSERSFRGDIYSAAGYGGRFRYLSSPSCEPATDPVSAPPIAPNPTPITPNPTPSLPTNPVPAPNPTPNPTPRPTQSANQPLGDCASTVNCDGDPGLVFCNLNGQTCDGLCSGDVDQVNVNCADSPSNDAACGCCTVAAQNECNSNLGGSVIFDEDCGCCTSSDQDECEGRVISDDEEIFVEDFCTCLILM